MYHAGGGGGGTLLICFGCTGIGNSAASSDSTSLRLLLYASLVNVNLQIQNAGRNNGQTHTHSTHRQPLTTTTVEPFFGIAAAAVNHPALMQHAFL